MPSLVEVGPVVQEKMKMLKVYDNDDNVIDDDDSQTTDKSDQKSSLEP